MREKGEMMEYHTSDHFRPFKSLYSLARGKSWGEREVNPGNRRDGDLGGLHRGPTLFRA